MIQIVKWRRRPIFGSLLYFYFYFLNEQISMGPIQSTAEVFHAKKLKQKQTAQCWCNWSFFCSSKLFLLLFKFSKEVLIFCFNKLYCIGLNFFEILYYIISHIFLWANFIIVWFFFSLIIILIDSQMFWAQEDLIAGKTSGSQSWETVPLKGRYLLWGNLQLCSIIWPNLDDVCKLSHNLLDLHRPIRGIYCKQQGASKVHK